TWRGPACRCDAVTRRGDDVGWRAGSGCRGDRVGGPDGPVPNYVLRVHLKRVGRAVGQVRNRHWRGARVRGGARRAPDVGRNDVTGDGRTAARGRGPADRRLRVASSGVDRRWHAWWGRPRLGVVEVRASAQAA